MGDQSEIAFRGLSQVNVASTNLMSDLGYRGMLHFIGAFVVTSTFNKSWPTLACEYGTLCKTSTGSII